MRILAVLLGKFIVVLHIYSIGCFIISITLLTTNNILEIKCRAKCFIWLYLTLQYYLILYMGISKQYSNNGGTFSQHTHFWMTSRNVAVYRKCSNDRLPMSVPNAFYSYSSQWLLGKCLNLFRFICRLLSITFLFSSSVLVKGNVKILSIR